MPDITNVAKIICEAQAQPLSKLAARSIDRCTVRGRALSAMLLASLAALFSLTFPTGASQGQEKKEPKLTISLQDALTKITLSREAAKKSRLSPTPGFARVTFQHKIEGKDVRSVEPKVVQLERDGKIFAIGLQFTCDPIYINTFTVGGAALNASQFSYSVDTISWQAGDGWPVYTDYCPVNSYATDNYFPDAKTHQIVPIITGQNYFVGCASSAVCASNGAGQIAFAVNDTGVPGNDFYTDNRGYFVVTIWGVIQ